MEQEKMNPTERKYHYFRGFAVASIIWGIVAVIVGNILLGKLI